MELVNAAQTGDLECFGELGRRYFNVLLAVAYNVLGDHHLAEDAAQESLAKALVNLVKLRQPERFGTWLRKICRNVAHDMINDKADQAQNMDSSQVVDQNPESTDHEAVHRALDKLAPKARELVTLRYYNNCSYEQISAVMGMSKPAINGHLTRAKQKLAEYLQRYAQAEDIR